MAPFEQCVGEHASQDSADETANRRQRGYESSTQQGHATLLYQVDWEPGQEEIGQGGNAVLSNVDTHQHATAQQLPNMRPAQRWRSASHTAIHVDLSPSGGDILDLAAGKPRMLARAEY